MSFVPAIPAAASRLQALNSLRTKCLSPAHATSSGIVSRRQALLTHYPPNVDVTKLAAQDHKLARLGLVDVWMEMKLAREEAMTARGKTPRVSVATGKAKKPEGESGKKKKRK
ncbi:hypothetical protein DFJ77DRAFT_477297 [Powellomyces hirtus]|nr:hypothetical protein DFJ77DRAFT_477297 [Powellomyces hirtus]